MHFGAKAVFYLELSRSPIPDIWRMNLLNHSDCNWFLELTNHSVAPQFTLVPVIQQCCISKTNYVSGESTHKEVN